MINIFNTKFVKVALMAGAAMSVSTMAHATHGRGAAIVPSVSASGELTVDMVGFWRQDQRDPVCSFPHDCISATVTGPGGFLNTIGSTSASGNDTATLDLSDSRRGEVRQTDTLQLTGGAGLYTIEWGGRDWVNGVEGLSNTSYGTTSTIFWDGQTANAPILFDLENVQQEVVRGANYSDNLDAISGNGGALTYATSTPGSLTGVQDGPDTFAVDAAGNLTIDAGNQGAGTGTYDIGDNASNAGADHAFEGSITNADGSSVEFYWVFDGVDNTGTNNLAPEVDDIVVSVIAGQTLNQVVTATDANTGDTLTLDLISFNGPGGIFPVGLTGASPLSSTFVFDAPSTAAGQSFLATFQASDGSLTDRGTVRINVIADNTSGGIPPVPLPATALLLGGALMGLGAFRRRNRRC